MFKRESIRLREVIISEDGKLRKIFGLIIFTSLSFLVALISVWILLIKGQPGESATTGLDSLNTMRQTSPDTTQSSVSQKDSLIGEAEDTLLSPSVSLADKKKEWEEFRKEKLKSYLNVLKHQAQKEDENLARINKLILEKDSLNQEVNKVSDERDQRKKELDEYKNSLANVVANDVVSYYKKRDAKKDSIDNTMKKKELAVNGAGIKKLAKMFESMRPEQAVPFLSKLKDEEIINILFKMKQRNAAKIITYFDPKLAVRITRKISEK